MTQLLAGPPTLAPARAAAWEDFWRGPQAHRVAVPGSDLARWVDAHLPAGARVVDLGTGNGRDATFFARQGRPVLAYDVSRAALDLVRTRARRQELEVDVRRLDLGSLAGVLTEGTELARSPYHLYARQLIGCLDATARSNLWVLARMALRGQGLLVLGFSATGPAAVPGPEGLVQRLDPALVRREIGAAGGRVGEEWLTTGVGLLGGRDPRVCRMVVSWPAPAGGR
jgi:SAM-dependent methyltransferase